jgi:glycosyltransferase involved in cell wall biosynthesis
MLQPTSSVNYLVVNAEQINYDANLKPLVAQLPLLSCEICVIVPVRNEAKNLEATLVALTNQVDFQGKPLNKKRYEIIVLANNCTDNSVEIARCFARSQPDLVLHVVEMTLTSDRSNIGWVRKILMDEAYRRFRYLGRDRGVIASTDGDTRVSPTWITAILMEISNGCDGVGGRIITEREERLALDKSTRLYFLRYVGYRYLVAQLETLIDFDPVESWPRHHQHFGASLAVTAQIYAKVGGLPPLPSSEDVALYEALKRFDACFRHSNIVKVTTSARAIGRAKAGLSDRLSQLKVMAQKKQPILVESAEAVKARFALRYRLRYLWHSMQQDRVYPIQLAIIAQKLQINDNLLAKIIIYSPTFGLVIARIGEYQQNNSKLNCHWQKVKIQQAISDLRLMRNELSERSHHLSLDSLKQIKPISLLAQSL